MSFHLRDDVSLAETANGAVLLDESSGRYWQTNATGALVLRALLDGKSDAEIGQLLSSKSRVTAEHAIADVIAFREHLRTSRLVAW